jgi:hypothetical protein
MPIRVATPRPEIPRKNIQNFQQTIENFSASRRFTVNRKTFLIPVDTIKKNGPMPGTSPPRRFFQL